MSIYPTIHDDSGNDLETQGYGALSDCISAEVTEELNGGYSLTMKYPLKGIHSEHLAVGNIIMAKPNHAQTQQPFRIAQVKRSFGSSISVIAYHICYDLSGYPMPNAQTYNSLSAVFDALNNASWSTGVATYHQFTFRTDMTANRQFKMDSMQTVRSWMGGQEGSILDTYGGEWEYDKFECYLKTRRGSDTGIRISYGKNLAEYSKELNNVAYSHICAFWKKSELYAYSDLIGTGVMCPFRCAYYDASNDFETQPTKTQLNTVATEKASAMNMTAQTITVTPVQIGEVIGLGDSVLICYDEVFQTRVIKTVWNVLAGVYSKLELGTKKTSIADTIKSLTTAPSGESGYVDPSADYVLEEGTSSGWFYRKWNSGKYECWRRDSSKKATINQQWGNFYYGTLSAWNYPITFVGDYPVVNITVQANNGGAWAVPDYSTYSFTSTGTIYLYRPSQVTNMNLTVNIYAFGRWK